MSVKLGPDYVRAIAPYQSGKPIAEVAREFGLDEAGIVKLASNENPLGMPESAKLAIQREMAQLGRYPDANGFDLKALIGAQYDVPESWITLGNGSNDILELAAHALVQPTQGVVYSEYAFLVYALAAQATGARSIVVAATAYGHDLPAMLAAIDDDTRLVYIANPNNPTGTFVTGVELEQFLTKVPSQVVVVLDEAYTEYLPSECRYDSIAWVRQFPNLIVSRTMSKAYGLAGLRIGFGIAQPELTDLLNRIRQPFNVNSLAQAAAMAALQDHEFLQRSAELNQQGYRQLTAAFDRLGLEYLKSYGNFVMFRAGNEDNAGARINLALLRQGVIVRPLANYGLPQWLRVTIGLEQENQRFLAALETALT